MSTRSQLATYAFNEAAHLRWLKQTTTILRHCSTIFFKTNTFFFFHITATVGTTVYQLTWLSLLSAKQQTGIRRPATSH